MHSQGRYATPPYEPPLFRLGGALTAQTTVVKATLINQTSWLHHQPTFSTQTHSSFCPSLSSQKGGHTGLEHVQGSAATRRQCIMGTFRYEKKKIALYECESSHSSFVILIAAAPLPDYYQLYG
eukprot:5796934-Pleurochrysis_carterae.AAC.4